MHKKMIIFLSIALLLTGCWDKVEIDERAHISALGIDRYTPGPDDEETVGRHIFTFAFPELKKEGAKDVVISSVGDNLYSVSRIMASRSNKEFFLGHLRTVVVGVDIAKNPADFRHILDGIENNEFLSRRVVLALTEGSAAEIIKVVPAMENKLGEFIAEIFRRSDRIPRIVGGSAGDILRDLHESGNTIIPKIVPGKADVKVAGGGIINNFKFKGWLGEVETAHLLVLKGETKCLCGMSVKHKGFDIPVALRPKKPRISLIEDKDNIKILIEVEMEGDVRQTYFETDEDTLKSSFVSEIEQEMVEATKQRAMDTINKIQKEFETDVLGINKYLRQSHYKLWKEVERDWQDIFPNIDIDVNIDIKIRRIGLVR
ncbi:MAG: Ger(x)C family spore germination protein [Natronincolaceae bacterium]|jgi:spore germination protein KC|nr:Ger(x)C family spore germination protein [Bacillota bacterium]NLK90425.1 Ger(x)C family spore germination protein [Clostridiales bacterium]